MRQDHFIFSSPPRPAIDRAPAQPAGPALFGWPFATLTLWARWQGTIMTLNALRRKRPATGRVRPPERASFAKPLSSCERPATKSKHSSTPLTRPDGFTAGANISASKWISTFPSTAASADRQSGPTARPMATSALLPLSRPVPYQPRPICLARQAPAPAGDGFGLTPSSG